MNQIIDKYYDISWIWILDLFLFGLCGVSEVHAADIPFFSCQARSGQISWRNEYWLFFNMFHFFPEMNELFMIVYAYSYLFVYIYMYIDVLLLLSLLLLLSSLLLSLLLVSLLLYACYRLYSLLWLIYNRFYSCTVPGSFDLIGARKSCQDGFFYGRPGFRGSEAEAKAATPWQQQ